VEQTASETQRSWMLILPLLNPDSRPAGNRRPSLDRQKASRPSSHQRPEIFQAGMIDAASLQVAPLRIEHAIDVA
jgi:hypothetical protein